MRLAVTSASPIRQGVLGSSWKFTRAGVSIRSIGKSGGENERRIRSLSVITGERGPQRSIVVSGSKSGAKKRRPSRWSRCRCVSRRFTCLTPSWASWAPSSRLSVPASSTKTAPSSSEISMHDVFPPHLTVCGPGVGTEPRQPQILTRMPSPNLLPPEDPDDPDELVRLGEEREGGDRDLPVDAVPAQNPQLLVRGTPLLKGDPGRPPLVGQRRVVPCPGLEARRELGQRHLADLGERVPDDLLGGLVEEDEHALGICNQRRRGEIRRQLSGQDQDQMLRPGGGHRKEDYACDGGRDVSLPARLDGR